MMARHRVLFVYLVSLSTVFGLKEVTFKCEEGWWKFENRCYRILGNAWMLKSFAIALCNTANSQLFVPSNQEEYDAVTEYVDNLGSVSTDDKPMPTPITDVWIGCDDEDVEGIFSCIDGTTFTSLSVNWWDSGHGVSTTNKCVRYWKDIGLGELSCSSDTSQVLCEAPAKLYKVSRDYGLISKPDGSPLKGYCLKGYIALYATVKNLVECAGLCLAHDQCQSFNWQQQDGRCEINLNTTSAAGENSMEARRGCNYFEPVQY
nr:uncharacterized protein LOC129272926 [Lytechinus pictus]